MSFRVAAIRTICISIDQLADRKPVFVGDDTTDESVFNVLPMLGGIGYSVERFIPGAIGTIDSPHNVRCWLARLCGRDESDRP